MERLTAELRIFVSGAWLAFVGLFQWLRPTDYVASKIIAPFTYMAFFVLLGVSATGRNTAEFYIVGNAIETASLSGFVAVTFAIVNERWFGTLTYLIASPANRLAVFLGRAFFNIFDGSLTVAICFLWGVVLGLDLSRANLPALALTIVVVTISTSGLGFLVGSLGLMTPNVLFVVNVIFFLLLIFTGANIPLDKLDPWMQAFSGALPLTRGIQSARLLVGGAPLVEVLPLLGGELLVGVAYTLAGYAVFRWFESRARARGTFEAI
jgi:ABC-2 type transport system permease protein